MVREAKGRVFRSGEARTLYVSIPAELASDSTFPFEADDAVTVRVEDDRLVVVDESEDEGESED